MGEYVRIIKRSKWPTEEAIENNIDNIEAKTIVQEMAMKYDENCLSIWKLDDKKDIILALMNTQKSNTETVTALKITDELLAENGLIIKNVPGNSLVEELNSYHYDVVDMNYKNLGDFARVIMTALKDEENNLKRITRKEMKDILIEAISNERIKSEELSEDMRRDLKIV